MGTLTEAPKVWREDHDLSALESLPEYQDKFSRSYWPQNGFIDDFVTHTYGWETTNLFAFWSAVAGLSGIIQRDCSLKFGNSGLFPNFYIILVAPPAICHKSTAMILYEDVEEQAKKLITDVDLLKEKEYKPVKGKVTAEALFDAMANIKYKDIYGNDRVTTAKMVARISELTTMLSKAQYNAQLVDKLTDFYDCKSIDTDITRGNGAKTLTNIYASLFAATTPDALKHSIPEQAFGGGFMSRTIIVDQPIDDIKRIQPIPYTPRQCPKVEDMGERLAWLMENKFGEYSLSPEAMRFYDAWYRAEITDLRAKAMNGESDHRNNRKSIHVLKLALLLAIQRYDTSTVVTLSDLRMAVDIINYTLDQSTDTVESIYLASIEDGDMKRFLNAVRRAGPDGITRAKLARNYNFKRFDIDEYLKELSFKGMVEVRTVELEELTKAGKKRKTKKLYYIGDRPLKEGED